MSHNEPGNEFLELIIFAIYKWNVMYAFGDRYCYRRIVPSVTPDLPEPKFNGLPVEVFLYKNSRKIDLLTNWCYETEVVQRVVIFSDQVENEGISHMEVSSENVTKSNRLQCSPKLWNIECIRMH